MTKPSRSSAHLSTYLLSLALLLPSISLADAGADESPLIPANTASSDAILATVSALESFGTRAFTLPDTNLVAEYLSQEFESLGLEVVKQEFTVGGHPSGNVVAWKNGTDEDRPQVLVGAHYDSENSEATDLALTELLPAPGADDDASGVAAIMEVARLIAGRTTMATVKFVAFGAEERGYDDSGGGVGSRYFAAAEKAAGVEYAATFIVDMIGFRSGDVSRITLLTNDEADEGVDAMIRFAGANLPGLDIVTIVRSDIMYSDHASFWLMGYPSALITEEVHPTTMNPLNPYYHTSEDTIDKLCIEQTVLTTDALTEAVLLLSAGEQWEQDSSASMLVGAAVATACAAVAVLVIRKGRNGRHD